MNKIMLSVIMLVAIASLYGCNTIKGLGNDVGAVGGWISNGSDHVSESIKKNPPGSGVEQ